MRAHVLRAARAPATAVERAEWMLRVARTFPKAADLDDSTNEVMRGSKRIVLNLGVDPSDALLAGDREVALAHAAREPNDERLHAWFVRDRDVVRAALATKRFSYKDLPPALSAKATFWDLVADLDPVRGLREPHFPTQFHNADRLARGLAAAGTDAHQILHCAWTEAFLDEEAVLTSLVHTDFSLVPDAARTRPSIVEAAFKTPSHFKQLPRAIREDPASAARAVATAPWNYLDIGSQQNRRELALSFLTATGVSLAHVPVKLHADRDVALGSVCSQADNWDLVPVELTSALDFQRDAIARDPTLLLRASPALRDDATYVLDAIRRGAPLSAASDRLRDDPAFALEAVRVFPWNLAGASDRLRSDRAFCEDALLLGARAFDIDPALVKRCFDAWLPRFGADVAHAAGLDNAKHFLGLLGTDPMAADTPFLQLPWNVLSEEQARALCKDGFGAFYHQLTSSGVLAHDLDLARRAVLDYWPVVPTLPAAMKQDMELAVRAWTANPPKTDAPREDVEFLERVAERSLATLVARADLAANLFATRPDIHERYDAMVDGLAKLGVIHGYRFSTDGVFEIIKNRLEPRDPRDTRPTAVLVFTRTDHNGAFAIPNIDDLRKTHRVLYFEADSDRELESALVAAAKLDGPANLVVLCGHGNQYALALGGVDPASAPDKVGAASTLYLDASDEKKIKGPLSDVTTDGADLVLLSCYNGKGRQFEDNLANRVAAWAPHVRVWSSTEADNMHFDVDEAAGAVRPRSFCGEHSAYVIEPRARKG